MTTGLVTVPPVIELDAVVVGHGTRRRRAALLSRFTGRVMPGELVAVIGPNGAGKTTLLNTVTGLLRPVAGTVRLGGVDAADLSISERARHVAVVTSERPDTGLLRVDQLVALGRHPHTGWGGSMRAGDHVVVADALALVGVAGLRDRRVSTLSDGERQRVVVARALAQQAPLMVLDEPTAFMDVTRRVELLALVRSLADQGKAVLMATHDLELVLRVCDRVWVVGEGRVDAGTPAELATSGRLSAAFDHLLAYDPVSGRIEVGLPAARTTVRPAGRP